MKNRDREFLATITDHRGYLAEVLDAGMLETLELEHAHVVITRPGFVRGNHYHEIKAEVAIWVGPATVRIDAGRDGHVEEVDVGPGEILRQRYPPGVAHAGRANGPGPMFSLHLTDRAHDPANPDTYAFPLF